jgi:hypothetical protein
MRALAVAAALALGGCAASGHAVPMPTEYDAHLSPDIADLALVALNDWTTATGVVFRPVVTDDACPPFNGPLGYEPCFGVRLEPRAEIVQDCGAPDAVGCTSRDISAAALGEYGLTRKIMTHEVGHAIGLQHDTAIGPNATIMWPTTEESPVITARDVAQYDSLRGVNARGACARSVAAMPASIGLTDVQCPDPRDSVR